MLRSVRDLQTFRIGASDGTIGSVRDFYFDDEAWVIRYLVVDTGGWLGGREVLISPFSIGTPDWVEQILPVSITKEQVKHSPIIDTDKPVSRQHETGYLGYYGYPYYWGGAGLWGEGVYPQAMLSGTAFPSDAAYTKAQAANDRTALSDNEMRHAHDDPHLRSCNAVNGYHIHATDGDIGHVQGFLVDERTWAIRYFIVNTSNWWLGHLVLVSPAWIKEVSWVNSKVTTSLTRQQIQDAPDYDSQGMLSRGDEEGIYRHYGRRGYWLDDKDLAAA
jgi:hypothetical protein